MGSLYPVGGGGVGSVVQVVNTTRTTSEVTAVSIPFDNTIPQITEGREWMTRTITPTSATNKLKIDVVVMGSSSAGAVYIVAALFQDTTANALAAQGVYQTTINATEQVVFTHYMTAGTTSEITFRVRASNASFDTFTFNGYGSAVKLGGVASSSITVTEIVA